MRISKIYIYVGIAIFIGIALIAWHYYRKGKKAAGGYQANYPTGGNNIPPSWNPLPLVKELHDVMDSTFTFSGTKDEVWKKVLNLPTDDMIVSVYNVFNQNYSDENNGTLTQWIKDEWNYDFISGVKENLLARLAKLNLI